MCICFDYSNQFFFFFQFKNQKCLLNVLIPFLLEKLFWTYYIISSKCLLIFLLFSPSTYFLLININNILNSIFRFFANNFSFFFFSFYPYDIKLYLLSLFQSTHSFFFHLIQPQVWLLWEHVNSNNHLHQCHPLCL